jgi:hypothetical protein
MPPYLMYAIRLLNNVNVFFPWGLLYFLYIPASGQILPTCCARQGVHQLRSAEALYKQAMFVTS